MFKWVLATTDTMESHCTDKTFCVFDCVCGESLTSKERCEDCQAPTLRMFQFHSLSSAFEQTRTVGEEWLAWDMTAYASCPMGARADLAGS